MSVNLKGYYGDPAAVTKACDYVDERMAGAGIGVNFAENEIPQPTTDPKIFSLANTPTPSSSLKLYDGLRLRMPDDFSLSGNQITLAQVPVGNLVADYRY